MIQSMFKSFLIICIICITNVLIINYILLLSIHLEQQQQIITVYILLPLYEND